MADMLDGAALPAGGGPHHFPLEQWFYEMPICTRIWTAGTVAISILVQCHVVTPLTLFYSVRAVFLKNQYWRLLTTFLYFGPLSLDLLLHVFFLQRYSRLLEESAGRSPAQYLWLLCFAAGALLGISSFWSLLFLGHALSSVLVYIWSRRNPDTRLSFLGLVVFKAPFLPWVLVLFSLVAHGSVPREEICGIVVGHVYYFFTDVFPPMHSGYKPLDPPTWWIRLFEGRQDDADARADVDDHGTPAEELQHLGGQRPELAAPDVR